MHVWANAFKDQQSAYARQQLDLGNTDYYFSDENQHGYYDVLEFFVDENPVKWEYSENHMDIVILRLQSPIHPGQERVFSCKFKIRLPYNFSRLGHSDQNYYITQWYPKPAVFDDKGWHPMPYLDIGEFYAEFATYDVRITLPENYIVASTGTLIDQRERAFLKKVLSEPLKEAPDTNQIPPSSTKKNKTIRFLADRVHDFAWFASKEFEVQRDTLQLPNSTRAIELWSFYPTSERNLWKNSTKMMKRAVSFYSDEVDPYPFNQVSAVSNPNGISGAMEYPMITLVGDLSSEKELDQFLAHEIGHNWFYGQLGFNERDHPWLDEGINSFYENKYLKQFYTSEELTFLPTKQVQESGIRENELAYLHLARKNLDQSPGLGSNQYTEFNYYASIYQKVPFVLNLLEQYIGKTRFKTLMQQFYAKWKFRHPSPSDFISHFEQKTGLDLGWCFEGLIGSNKKVDYRIKAIVKDKDHGLQISNLGELPVPFKLTGFNKGERKWEQWIEGFSGERIVPVPSLTYEKYKIDPDHEVPELFRNNNSIKTKGILKKVEPLRLKPLAGIDYPDYSNLYFSPAIGYNHYDKALLGFTLYNNVVLNKKLEWATANFIATGTGKWTGAGHFRWNTLPKTGPIRKWDFELVYKSFHFNKHKHYGFEDRYFKFSPGLNFYFKKKHPLSTVEHAIRIRNIIIHQKYGQGINYETKEFSIKKRNYYINELNYSIRADDALYPYYLDASAQQGEGFLKLFAGFKQQINYSGFNKRLELRFFGGWLPVNTNPLARVSFQISGINGGSFGHRDYLYDEWIFGRNETEGFFSQQIFKQDAGLKTLSNVGSSSEWMLGAGISSSIPGPLPVKPYFDITLSPKSFEDGVDLNYSSGLAFIIIPDMAEIYFPLFESKMITDGSVYQLKSKYSQRISFLFDLNKADPWKLRDRIFY